MKTVYVNGRFLAQPVSGVQRVAREVLRALDARLERSEEAPVIPSEAKDLAGRHRTATSRGRWVLLCPPGVEVPAYARIAVMRVGSGDGRGWRGHAWEQTVLPRAAADGLLVNLAGTAPAFARGPQIATLHDAAVFDHPEAYTRAFGAWYRWMFRRLARKTVALVTVSVWSRERLSRAVGVAADRITVIANGSDHLDAVPADGAIVERLGLAGRPFLLVVGSANPNKNLARIVEAWNRLDRGDARLVIVGDTRDHVFVSTPAPSPRPSAQRGEGATSSAGPLSRGRERARGEGARSAVIQAGPVSDAELSALYRIATALVFPSLHEGYGLPAVEAMRLGCPVIAARQAALPEVCGDAALYVDDARDPAAIAAAMQRVLDDRTLRADLAARGRRQTLPRTWDAAAARWLTLVDRVEPAARR